ncbi:MAG TPA: hypothetical protein VM406_01425 [Noviherbaspirillum sp.]|nr:hypothetical protein [Noviherbaspirillum sp.]
MSLISALVPAEAVLANAGAVARPLLGLGLLTALVIFFRPFLAGLLRAALMVLAPRTASALHAAREKAAGVMMLHRMAREVERNQPALAAELRAIASRD